MFRRTMLAFIPLALIGALVMLVLFGVLAISVAAVFRSGQEKVVRIARQELAGEVSMAFADVRYLARQPTLGLWLAGGDPSTLETLAHDHRVFVTEKRIYDQVRYLNLEGREITRVRWNQGDPVVVTADRLLDRDQSYYVDELADLQPGQVYVSPFDLSMQGGEVQQPPKPMIRFGAPVFDPDGRRRGTVVLHYLGAPLLERIRRLGTGEEGQVWLLNERGFWLIGPTLEDEWAFMYADAEGRSMARAYPAAWERIRDGGAHGQFRMGGLFTYARAAPAVRRPARSAEPQAAADLPTWLVVSHVPSIDIAARRNQLILMVLAAYLVLAAVLAGVALLIARQRLRRERAESLLRSSEARFRHLVESAPDAVVIADAGGRIEVVNAQTEQLFGHPRETLIGEPVEVLLPERYRVAHAGHRARYVAGPTVRPMGAHLELKGLRADGSEFPVEVSLSPVETEEGPLILADIRDVTEKRASQREIQELNTRLMRDNADLAAVNEELEAFSYSVSHDLRAPLRAIDGFSQALLEDCADRLDDEGRRHLDRVRNAAQRMGQLIDDLLKLSRVARAQLDVQEVDVSALARDVLTDLTSREPGRQVEASVEEGLRAEADPRLLRIALENLFGNAWKFTAGRSPARIELARVRREGEELLRLSDNGVGFDMRYVDQLFRAFQRLHDAGAFPGTGIGLATVQRIVHKHGGRVWAEAEVGRGASFYFSL